MMTRVRFAPSPTGYLHIGAARAALFNYLYARHTGGKFLLRIEDTDLQRSTDESTRSILDGLKWLELEPEEEIVFQSANAEKHRQAALKLLAEGKAYRDFTPKKKPSDQNIKETISERARQNQGEKSMRDNPYRDLSNEEADAKAEAGEPFAARRNAITRKLKTLFCFAPTVIRFIISPLSATTLKCELPMSFAGKTI
jgi:glutamyl-tRNA synthetase